MARKLPNKTQVRAVLQSALFNPAEPGPMAVIIDDATPDYLDRRAAELIKEGRRGLAISLLAYAQTLEVSGGQRLRTKENT